MLTFSVQGNVEILMFSLLILYIYIIHLYLFIFISKSLSHTHRAIGKEHGGNSFNECSVTLFINVVNWLFYLECAINWKNIKLMDSITSLLLLEL